YVRHDHPRDRHSFPTRRSSDLERFGAQGITVHPRPDERHIRYADVRALKPRLSTEFNIEGYPNASFLELVLEVRPAQVTLVPDRSEEHTSELQSRENLVCRLLL